MKNILIRCDASGKIGLGHIVRCLELANKLQTLDNFIVFAMKNYKIGLEKVSSHGFKIEIAPKNFDYSKWLEHCLSKHNINIFIGDVRDGLPRESIKEMKNKSILTVAIDEPSIYAKECDLCFYPPHAKIDEKDYLGKVYQGFEYLILRDEFYREYKKTKNLVPNILIMMGGTDPCNLTLKILNKLLSLDKNINISVIIKKNHRDYSLINSFENTNVKVYSDVKNMVKFLQEINFGIISFGVSAYELVAMHIPSIHVCLDEDHFISSKVFEGMNLAISTKQEDIQNISLDFLMTLTIQGIDIKENKIVDKIMEFSFE